MNRDRVWSQTDRRFELLAAVLEQSRFEDSVGMSRAGLPEVVLKTAAQSPYYGKGHGRAREVGVGVRQMSVVTPKTLRQQLVQSAVLDKIMSSGISVDTEPVRRNLRTIRRQVGRSPLMDRYLDRWDRIVRDNDIDGIRTIVESDDDTSREMRNLSPLSVLLSDDERQRVLNEFGTRLRGTATR